MGRKVSIGIVGSGGGGIGTIIASGTGNTLSTALANQDLIIDPNGTGGVSIAADLTIKGITKEITFPAFVVIKKTGEVVANASFDIDRTAFDIKYGSKSFFEGIGDKAIDDKFNVKVRIVATK